MNLAHRYSKLKKQLEDMTDCRDIASGHRKEVQDRETILLSQQQEFIKYLEDEINYIQSSIVNLPVISNERNYLANLGNNLLRVLQKYKEIIGVQNESR